MRRIQSRASKRGIDVWLIHGLGDAPRVWRGVRKQRALARYRVIAPALPGFDGTPPLPRRRQKLAGLAHWLQGEIRRHSRGRHVVLVGHSMGGMVGTIVASQIPDLLGFINIEGPITLADCETSRAAAESEDFARWFRAFRRAVRTPGSGAPAHYGAGIVETDVPSFRAYAEDIVALARGVRIGKMYAALRAPHVFFYGAKPGGIAKRALAFLKVHGCKTEGFADAAHWPMVETPREFEKTLARTIERFL